MASSILEREARTVRGPEISSPFLHGVILRVYALVKRRGAKDSPEPVPGSSPRHQNEASGIIFLFFLLAFSCSSGPFFFFVFQFEQRFLCPKTKTYHASLLPKILFPLLLREECFPLGRMRARWEPVLPSSCRWVKTKKWPMWRVLRELSFEITDILWPCWHLFMPTIDSVVSKGSRKIPPLTFLFRFVIESRVPEYFLFLCAFSSWCQCLAVWREIFMLPFFLFIAIVLGFFLFYFGSNRVG